MKPFASFQTGGFRRCLGAALGLIALGLATAKADTFDLMNGATVEGTLLENNAAAKTLTLEFTLGGNLVKRTVPYATVHAITVNGVRTELTPKPGGGSGTAAASAGPATRTAAEVKALVAQTGGSDPEWLSKTRLNIPKTLDLDWPEPAPKGWNNQKNVGQFIWDIINPNDTRWEEGVKFMYHLMDLHKGDRAKHERVVKSLASMYFRFFQDYSRAAYWWQQTGVGPDDNDAVGLAECYWRLGNKQMALDLVEGSRFLRLGSIKLLGDMLETEKSLKMASDFVGVGGEAHEAWLLAGDSCRTAGRLEEAATYYQRVLDTPAEGNRAERQKKVQARATASLEALKLFELADLKQVRDGTYQDSSLGYEGQVQVGVTVRGGKIQSVKITQHKEKQYYSALTDVPDQILAKQGVKGVDATSRATITAEAIINATAKALAKGVP